MASGPQTTIALLAQKLQRRWVPKWYEAFCDHETGGFHERLGRNFKPIKTGQRRLVTQCRQLSVYAHAAAQERSQFTPDLQKHLDFMLVAYKGKHKGGWMFSLDDNGRTLDDSYDLYAHAFVIFALAHYEHAVKDGQARALALETLGFIESHFTVEGGLGLSESLSADLRPIDTPRRHESHMHLLEACLFAYEVFQEPVFFKMSDHLIALFRNYFYQENQGILSEYYNGELHPQPRDKHIVTEPGHYCEWIWLLKRHAVLQGDSHRYDDMCVPLLEWANEYGWDPDYGGIYDELNDKNEVITDTKRIWPFSEALKANALMLDSGMDKGVLKDRIALMVQVFKDHYMDERGFWTEWLSRDLQPQTDYMPGTTPYHVYFGVVESMEALQSRGHTKSLKVGFQVFVYNFRRSVSEFIKGLRGLFVRNA